MIAKDTYHHGNLRRVLLDEALSVIAEKGVEGLSLREIASRVGVSHQAPYHHFADKTALIVALATEGMSLMDASMAAAEEAAHGDSRQRLLGIGMAYVRFAVERPDYYAAFTAPELQKSGGSNQPQEAEGDTWRRLLNAVLACQEEGVLPQGDPMILAVYLWSLVHGLAELWRLGPLDQMPQGRQGLEPLATQVLMAAVGTVESGAAQGGSWSPCPEGGQQ
jgi:AcrR family transcriptional regulator